ncbi:hypothetical protein GCM10027043_31770 [Ferruginibacter profundus]
MVLVFVQTVFATAVIFDITYNTEKTVFYNDDKYRVEYVRRFMSKFESLPDLFIKKGLFEEKIVLSDKYEVGDMELFAGNIKKVVITEKSPQKINMEITYTVDTVKVKKEVLTVEVDLDQ